jgi:hypothetical protein
MQARPELAREHPVMRAQAARAIHRRVAELLARQPMKNPLMKLLLLATRRKVAERLPPATHHRVAEPDNSSAGSFRVNR